MIEGDGEGAQGLTCLEWGTCRAKSGENMGKIVLLILFLKPSSRLLEVLGCELCTASENIVTVMLVHSSAPKMGVIKKTCTNVDSFQ